MRRIFENQKFIKGNLAADFFGGPPKLDRGTKNLLVFFKMTVMDILKKSVNLQTRLLSEIIRVFNNRFWGRVIHPPPGLIGRKIVSNEHFVTKCLPI